RAAAVRPPCPRATTALPGTPRAAPPASTARLPAIGAPLERLPHGELDHHSPPESPREPGTDFVAGEREALVGRVQEVQLAGLLRVAVVGCVESNGTERGDEPEPHARGNAQAAYRRARVAPFPHLPYIHEHAQPHPVRKDRGRQAELQGGGEHRVATGGRRRDVAAGRVAPRAGETVRDAHV